MVFLLVFLFNLLHHQTDATVGWAVWAAWQPLPKGFTTMVWAAGQRLEGGEAAGCGCVVSAGGFRLPPAGLGFASEVREGRGGRGGGAARGFFGLWGGWWRGRGSWGGGGGLSADAPLSTRAKREMPIRRPRCAARSKTLRLCLFSLSLFNHPESHLGTITPGF